MRTYKQAEQNTGSGFEKETTLLFLILVFRELSSPIPLFGFSGDYWRSIYHSILRPVKKTSRKQCRIYIFKQ